MNKLDYINKVNVILEDKSKFVELKLKPESLIIKNEYKLNSLLKKLKKEEIILKGN